MSAAGGSVRVREREAGGRTQEYSRAQLLELPAAAETAGEQLIFRDAQGHWRRARAGHGSAMHAMLAAAEGRALRGEPLDLARRPLRETQEADGEGETKQEAKGSGKGEALRMEDIPWSDTLSVWVNGARKDIAQPDPTALLLHFLRGGQCNLPGTKEGCGEGGCGCCTVALTTAADGTRSVNSCLRKLCSCDGQSITTVEGINGGCGSNRLHAVQRSMVAHSATQCGFCSPGWVTNMWGFLVGAAERGEADSLTEEQIEAYLDGNLCRCTGYRSILAAFKTFATDKDEADSNHADNRKKQQRRTVFARAERVLARKAEHEEAAQTKQQQQQQRTPSEEEGGWQIVTVPSSATDADSGTGCGAAAGSFACDKTAGCVGACASPGGACPHGEEHQFACHAYQTHGRHQHRHHHDKDRKGGDDADVVAGLMDVEDLCRYAHLPSREETKATAKGQGEPEAPGISPRVRQELAAHARALRPLHFRSAATGTEWFRPVTLAQTLAVVQHKLKDGAGQQLQIVAGNTSIGVSKYLNGTAPYQEPDEYTVFVDVSAVPDFTATDLDVASGRVTAGAALSLNSLADLFDRAAGEQEAAAASSSPGCASTVGSGGGTSGASECPFSVAAAHLRRIAGNQVRNAGSWAGNLMLQQRHPYPSDALVALAVAGARLTLFRADTGTFMTGVTMQDLLAQRDLLQSPQVVVLSLTAEPPVLSVGERVVATSYKIMQRHVNAVAVVNAGFLFTVTDNSNENRSSSSSSSRSSECNDYPTCTSAMVLVGGPAQASFFAQRTQLFFAGRRLDSVTMQGALSALSLDIQDARGTNTTDDDALLDSLADSLLYKHVLRCQPAETVPSQYRSAVDDLVWAPKPASRGTEVFVPDPETAPVSMPVRKLEAPLQVSGRATYPSDDGAGAGGQGPGTSGTGALFGAVVYATRARVTLAAIDPAPALAKLGVVDVIDATDVPGVNSISGILGLAAGTADGAEPLFLPVGDVTSYVGQPIALVLAETRELALAAAPAVSVTYTAAPAPALSAGNRNASGKGDGDSADSGETAGPVITTIQEGMAAGDFVDAGLPPLSKGDVDAALRDAEHVLRGCVDAGGQRHFYMECNASVATTSDGGDVVTVSGSIQAPSAHAQTIAQVLGMPSVTGVNMVVRRAGGGFGCKLSRSAINACAAAVGAYKHGPGRSVSVFNQRDRDFNMIGGRDPMLFEYQIGFDDDGHISAYKVDMFADQGAFTDFSAGSLWMAQYWSDSAYCVENFRASATLVRTNTPPTCSMRAPGVVQSVLAMESAVEAVASYLDLDTALVQTRNFYRDGDTTPYGQTIADCTLPRVWGTLLHRAGYRERYEAAQEFNATNVWKKRGVYVSPTKYGIGWAGYNAGCAVRIVAADGSILVSHTGCEIGQGINTKVAQAVAYTLSRPLDSIRVTDTSTDKIANSGFTGGSGTSETTTEAALRAAGELAKRLTPFLDRAASDASDDDDAAWLRAITLAMTAGVSLNAEGWFSPASEGDGNTFKYFVYAAALTEVEYDVLTGEVELLFSSITYDNGQSLNPSVDIGQIEGAFVQGLGYFLTEKVDYDSDGTLESVGTWHYKPFTAHDIPQEFNVLLLADATNKDGIMGSKAVGEPPYAIASSALFATKHALAAARVDAGDTDMFDLPTPATLQVRQPLGLPTRDRLVF